jgi:hypothetical protein
MSTMSEIACIVQDLRADAEDEKKRGLRPSIISALKIRKLCKEAGFQGEALAAAVRLVKEQIYH